MRQRYKFQKISQFYCSYSKKNVILLVNWWLFGHLLENLFNKTNNYGNNL